VTLLVCDCIHNLQLHTLSQNTAVTCLQAPSSAKKCIQGLCMGCLRAKCQTIIIQFMLLQSCTPLSFLSYLHGPTAALPCTILAIIDSYPYHWLMDLRLRCLVPISAMPLTPSPFLDISVSLTVYEPALNHHSHSYISSSITMLFFTLILLGFTWNLVASLRLRNLRVWTDFYLRALLVDSLNSWNLSLLRVEPARHNRSLSFELVTFELSKFVTHAT
jgi:hypothetical protein